MYRYVDVHIEKRKEFKDSILLYNKVIINIYMLYMYYR